MKRRSELELWAPLTLYLAGFTTIIVTGGWRLSAGVFLVLWASKWEDKI